MKIPTTKKTKCPWKPSSDSWHWEQEKDKELWAPRSPRFINAYMSRTSVPEYTINGTGPML